MEAGGGDGSETGSVKEEGKKNRLISMPASPWTGIKKRATTT